LGFTISLDQQQPYQCSLLYALPVQMPQSCDEKNGYL
jgi:hypothetical protein